MYENLFFFFFFFKYGARTWSECLLFKVVSLTPYEIALCFLSCPVRSSNCFSYFILLVAAIGIPGFLIAPRNVPWSVVTVSSIWDVGGVISNYAGAQLLLMSPCHMLGLRMLRKMSVFLFFIFYKLNPTSHSEKLVKNRVHKPCFYLNTAFCTDYSQNIFINKYD